LHLVCVSDAKLTAPRIVSENVGIYLETIWLWRISGSYSLEMMGVILCRCSVELVWCSRSHWSPSASIRWGENVSWSTHRHKCTVSVFDCI